MAKACYMEELELSIDELGLTRVLEDIAIICERKTAHVRINLKDEYLALHWKKAAEALETFTMRHILPS